MQDRPVELVASAREFRAFTRARKITTPPELLRGVRRYGGLEQALRTAAGNLTVREERLTARAVRARFTACEAGGKALLPPGVVPLPLPLQPAGYRVSVIAGSSSDAPGADGTAYRGPRRLDLVSLTLLEWVVTDVPPADSVRHFTRGVGDMALGDRGYGQPAARVETPHRGADWIVRWNRGRPVGPPRERRSPG